MTDRSRSGMIRPPKHSAGRRLQLLCRCLSQRQIAQSVSKGEDMAREPFHGKVCKPRVPKSRRGLYTYRRRAWKRPVKRDLNRRADTKLSVLVVVSRPYASAAKVVYWRERKQVRVDRFISVATAPTGRQLKCIPTVRQVCVPFLPRLSGKRFVDIDTKPERHVSFKKCGRRRPRDVPSKRLRPNVLRSHHRNATRQLNADGQPAKSKETHAGSRDIRLPRQRSIRNDRPNGLPGEENKVNQPAPGVPSPAEIGDCISARQRHSLAIAADLLREKPVRKRHHLMSAHITFGAS